MMFTPPRARFQAGRADKGARFETPVMDTTLAAGLLAFAVTSFVLGMTRASATVLTIQCTFARVLGVVYTCDRSRSNRVEVQVQLLTLPAPSLALLRTAAHWLIAHFFAVGQGWIFVTSNLFPMIAVWKLLQDFLLTFDGP